jgi:endonuclease YncB( thermonuclease family)
MRLQHPKYLIFVPLLLLFLASHVFAAKTLLTGKAIKITDGDTVVISPIEDGAFFKCRLYGIVAPETQKTSKRGCMKKPDNPLVKNLPES